MAGPDKHTGTEKIPRRRRIKAIVSSCLCEWWSSCSSRPGSEQASDRPAISSFPAQRAESHSRFAAVKDGGRLTSAALTPRSVITAPVRPWPRPCKHP